MLSFHVASELANQKVEHHPEQELLNQVAHHDSKALEQIYTKYVGLLRHQIMQIVRCPDITADVLQDVFVQIWEKASVFDTKRGELINWLCTMARNRAIDQIRRHQRRNAASPSVSYLEELQSKHRGHTEDPFLLFAQAECREKLQRAIQVLPLSQRTVLRAAFFEGLTQSEIAERYQIPLGTVKTRMRQGLIELEKKLCAHL